MLFVCGRAIGWQTNVRAVAVPTAAAVCPVLLPLINFVSWNCCDGLLPLHWFPETTAMAHIVSQPCFNCKYTDCVVVCPVECFYEGESMLYIHPEECIDCEACVPECPVEAIFHEDNLPAEWTEFTLLNAEMSPQCPNITEQKTPMTQGDNCQQK